MWLWWEKRICVERYVARFGTNFHFDGAIKIGYRIGVRRVSLGTIKKLRSHRDCSLCGGEWRQEYELVFDENFGDDVVDNNCRNV